MKLRIINPFRDGRPGRRRNPTATTWALAAGAAALTLGIGTAAWAASRNKPKKKKPSDDNVIDVPSVTDCDPSPYPPIDPQLIRSAAEIIIDAGDDDPESVSAQVANTLFGKYPKGGSITFPFFDLDISGVDCVWSTTVRIVNEVFAERGIPSDPEDEISTDWVVHTASDPGYPWEEPTLHAQNYPTPGMFFDGNKNVSFNPASGFDAFIIALLASALSMAGQDPKIASASGQDPNASLGRSLRKSVRQAVIAPGGFNDLMYGQTNLNFAGGNDPDEPGGNPNKAKGPLYILNSEGRGLNWYPRHADMVSRIQSGLPILRTTTLRGNRIQGQTGASSQMLIYAPAFDLNPLAKTVPEIQTMLWSDGSSTINPPPAVQALGYDMNGVSLPGVG